MNWTDLVGPLVRLGAPLIGEALGGPLGATAGKVLAEVFGAGAATPESVRTAIEGLDPAAAARMAQAAEDKWLTALAEIGRAQVSEIGQTMRAEAVSGDLLQRWWRPLYALELTLLECPAFAFTLLRGLWSADEVVITGFGTVSALLITYFGARFGVLGVYVTGRTREKQTAVTGEAIPGMVAQVLKSTRGKKP